MDRLSDITLFLAVLDTGTISAAARRLNLSPAVASKRIQKLEKEIGVRLLHRTTRRISPTPEGLILASRGRPLVEELETLAADMGKTIRDVSGTLRITAGVSFGRRFITPLLAEFLAQYPKVEVQLHLSDEAEDIVDAGFDLAVRVATAMADSGLVARKLGESRRILCASPGYLEQNGKPDTVEKLSRHNCLLLLGKRGLEDMWKLQDARHEQHRVRVSGSMTSNLGDALYHAALSGLGISLHSHWHIVDDLNTGQLVQVLPEYFTPSAIYAVMPQRQFVPARVKAFVEFIERRFNESCLPESG